MPDNGDKIQTERQEQQSKRYENPLVAIKKALAEMAICRGAVLEKEHLSLYPARLVLEDLEDVLTSLRKLQEMPREKGEMALPELGAILQLVRYVHEERIRLSRARVPSVLVRWKCQHCYVTISGFVGVGADLKRKCRCGQPMDVVHQETTRNLNDLEQLAASLGDRGIENLQLRRT